MSHYTVKRVGLLWGQFASGLRGNDGSRKRKWKRNWKRKHGKCMLTSALVCRPHLWCCHSSCLLGGLSPCFCSCSVWYAATLVPRSSPDSFGRLFSRSFVMFVLQTHVFFLCIIVARSVSLATHWQCYVCTADSVIAMIELAYIALYSGV